MKCETVSCESRASMEVHWPGQTRRFCIACTARAVQVAAAMGFKLSGMPMPVAIDDTFDTTAPDDEVKP